MPGNGIGASLPRLEDARLLTGGGCYSDDFTLPNQARGFMLRSAHAIQVGCLLLGVAIVAESIREVRLMLPPMSGH